MGAATMLSRCTEVGAVPLETEEDATPYGENGPSPGSPESNCMDKSTSTVPQGTEPHKIIKNKTFAV